MPPMLSAAMHGSFLQRSLGWLQHH